MKRNWIILGLGLTMAFGLMGCTPADAPNVTPTPTNTVTPSAVPTPTNPTDDTNDIINSQMPQVTDNAVGNTNGGSRAGTGRSDHSALEDMGDGIKDVIDDVGDTARDIGDDMRYSTR